MRYAISLGNSRMGRHAANLLLQKGVPPADIIVVVRSPEKGRDLAERGLEVRMGAYGDRASLAAAFAGAGKLFMISGMAHSATYPTPPSLLSHARPGAFPTTSPSTKSTNSYPSTLSSTTTS